MFVSHLFQSDAKLDKARTAANEADRIAYLCRPLNHALIDFLADRADDVGEALAKHAHEQQAFKNRSIWSRKP